LKDKGLDVSLSDLLTEIAQRDERDRTRSASPLRPAEDAVVIDTSKLDVDGVFDAVWAVCGDSGR
jgi:cytidylate kinase